MIRKLTQEEVALVKPLVERERNFILYSNLQIRMERARCYGDYAGGRMKAFGCYLVGLPYHAFSLHVDGDGYDARQMMDFITEDLKLREESVKSAYLTLAEEDAAQIAVDGIRSKRTLVLMKLTTPEKLLPAQEAQRLDGSDLAAVNELARETGLMSFRKEELEEMPHVGIFDGDTLISMAGFHIYEDNYVELGNIATLPRLQGQRLGRRVTSEITRAGLEKTDAVYLFVFDDNLSAIRLYEKLGFETTQRYSIFELELTHSR